ncbi:MAG: dihydropteroate synthase [Acidobacteriota bacterium]|nr:dihydropteroate synthase [Acidobacteriota bacterium]
MLRSDYSTWRCGRHELSLSRPRIMGILNVTPDSFSDGGENLDAQAAITRGLQMLDEGADIIDVGGESTRPGATPVSVDEEGERVIPVVRALVDAGAIVSVDTRHAQLASVCLRLGASIINDVSGFTDPDMAAAVAKSNCGCVIMCDSEFRGNESRKSVVLESSNPRRRVPEPRQAPQVRRRFTLPEEAPVMRSIMGFLGDQARTLQRSGVSHDRICIDPGPGFNKSTDEDVVIQRAMRKLDSMGYVLMQAVSRKRFVGAATGVAEAVDRDAATIGMTIAAIEAGARVFRVHDVANVADAINGYWAVARKDPRQGFVSLGSNVGDRLGYLARACDLINQIPLTCVVAVSHAYETAPAYGIATPVANAVAEIKTELHPLVLMGKLLEVEDQLDRVRSAATAGHGPRTIDCDLVWVEDERHAGPRLTLPHPRLGERDYVLVPMEDLMHDPVRFLSHGGVDVLPPEMRVGHVTSELGVLDWE